MGATTRGPGELREPPRRPRLTGRAAILVLVLAVLAVSYASSMRAYLQQRQHIADLRAQIDETGSNIDQLEREKRRWEDDAYVRKQARERFGYVMPGETPYLVLDENGEPLGSPDTLDDPSNLPQADPEAWWDVAWASVEAAGNPKQDDEPKPVSKIKAPTE